MYICIYVCICSCTYVSMYVLCTCIYICIYVCRTFVDVCKYMCLVTRNAPFKNLPIAHEVANGTATARLLLLLLGTDQKLVMYETGMEGCLHGCSVRWTLHSA